VGRLSESIVNSQKLENREVMAKIAYLIGVTHDFGKATAYFQDALNTGRKSRNARHGLLSSLLTYQVVKDYLTATGKLKELQWLPAIAWVVVKRHHGNIRNLIGEDNAEATTLNEPSERALVTKQIDNILSTSRQETQSIFTETIGSTNTLEFFEEIRRWEALAKEIRVQIRSLRREAKMDNYLVMLFLYSVLLDADKMDASATCFPPRILEIDENLVDRYRNAVFTKSSNRMNIVREQAYKETVESFSRIDIQRDRFLSMNLPTGIGKTLAGFSFSLKLRNRISKELGFVPRIIYCLPFLSIIDQNGSVIGRVLQDQFPDVPSNLFLKHHHLADIRYVELNEEELYDIEDIDKALLLMEAWDSEVVITTFVQFFHSLITNRNRAARKFHNMANSIIILDEVQAIPSKYWQLINEMLNLFTEKYNCWIVLMTATQPLIFRPDQMKELISNKKAYFEAFDRVEFHLDLDENGNLASYRFEDFCDSVFPEIVEENDKNIMIVLNTIGACQQLYEYLKERLLSHHGIIGHDCIDDDGICNLGKSELINLSTHVLPAARLRRINRIRDDDRRKIVVTTQLIEAGVDISMDIVYRDLAPLDCIIQTAGRCNRNNEKEKGLFKVVQLQDCHGKFFHSFIYDRVLIDATRQALAGLGSKFSERDLTGAINRYYKVIKERSSSHDSEEIMQYLRMLDLSDVARFELIEECSDTVSIFLEYGDEAQRIRKNIEDALQENGPFERRRKLAAMKKQINENTITLRCSGKQESIMRLPTLFDEGFRYVPKECIQKWYKKDTGFTIPEDGSSSTVL
jgi:CRISPR-associated endonuclease/helicase Cas3